MTIWHTRQEKKIIKSMGAKPHHPGYDGVLPNGQPVEVRASRKDDRYRIQQDVHKQMVAKNGVYVFTDGSKTENVPAREVSQIMGPGNWYKDRNYPHRFIKKEDIF